MKTKQLFNKYTKISSLYITKEQAHAENYNPEDSYSANILFKKHIYNRLNPYNTNLNSTPALHSF